MTKRLDWSLTKPDSRTERDGGLLVDMDILHPRPELGLCAFTVASCLWPRAIHIVRLFRAFAATALWTRKPCEYKG